MYAGLSCSLQVADADESKRQTLATSGKKTSCHSCKGLIALRMDNSALVKNPDVPMCSGEDGETAMTVGLLQFAIARATQAEDRPSGGTAIGTVSTGHDWKIDSFSTGPRVYKYMWYFADTHAPLVPIGVSLSSLLRPPFDLTKDQGTRPDPLRLPGLVHERVLPRQSGSQH
ncbi:hypothetical protein BV25DRAFT_1441637 [Artomyces pyxidatus]|uniref:Uncharacterized protein n=1 Tax=Artomyces pyxidatus TaxID=48021 RepID=A0ACB8SLF4_9AGAM|nr:hypothetical protein BV25DRAFT_1441637 [Artomyces pyxidatus]